MSKCKRVYLANINGFRKIYICTYTLRMRDMLRGTSKVGSYASKQLNRVRANLKSCLFRAVISACVRSRRELIPLSICVAQESHSRPSARPRRRRVRNSVLKVYRPHGRAWQGSRLRERAGIPLRGSRGTRNSVVTYVSRAPPPYISLFPWFFIRLDPTMFCRPLSS